MNDKQCACGSNSTVLDGGKWVCFQHITPCKCKRNHEVNNDWDFNQNRPYGLSNTVESMDYQITVDPVPNGHGGYMPDVDAPPFEDLDRKNDPEIKKWLKG